MFISNAFSLNMLAQVPASIEVHSLDIEQAQKACASGFISCVGHSDTAALFSQVLGIPIPMNRQSVSLRPGDTLLVGQYNGPRLPEGTTRLPEGATIRWFLVRVS